MMRRRLEKLIAGAVMGAAVFSPLGITHASDTELKDNNGTTIVTETISTSASTTDGNGNTVTNGTEQVIVDGKNITVTNHPEGDEASFDTAVGNEVTITGSGATAVGTGSSVNSVMGGTAVGAGAKVTSESAEDQQGTAIGFMAEVGKKQGVAVGANANAKAGESVALGANSVADRENTVSVGSTGKERQVVNVADGTQDTDAVNLGQLKKEGEDTLKDAKAYSDELAKGKANVGLDNITDEGKEVIGGIAQDSVKVGNGDANIIVNSTVTPASGSGSDYKAGSTEYSVSLSDNLDLGNVTTEGDMNIKGNTTVGDSADDLMTVNATTNLKSDTVVDGKFSTNGDTVIGSDKADTLTVNATTTFKSPVTFESGATYQGDVSAGSFSIGGKTYVSDKGLDANGNKVQNVGDGNISAGSKDAVNGGQLYDAESRIKDGMKNEIASVGAQAAAMASLHPMEFTPDNKVSVAASFGTYKGDKAGAVGAFYRPDSTSLISVEGSIGNDDNMIGVGYSRRIGKGVDLPAPETLGQAFEDMKAENAQMKAENKELASKYEDVQKQLAEMKDILAKLQGIQAAK